MDCGHNGPAPLRQLPQQLQQVHCRGAVQSLCRQIKSVSRREKQLIEQNYVNCKTNYALCFNILRIDRKHSLFC